jgi:hypothetical protein
MNHTTTPYTYLIGWTAQNLWYYGRRTAKHCNPTDLWTKYFTSSAHVSDTRLVYGEPDVVQVRKVFVDPTECARWEARVLGRLKASRDPKFLNKTNGDTCWDNTGYAAVRDATGNIYNVPVDDPRRLSGELYGFAKGKTAVQDTSGTVYQVSVDDPRIASGELKSISIGWVALKGMRVREHDFDPNIHRAAALGGHPIMPESQKQSTSKRMQNTVLVKKVDNHSITQRVPVGEIPDGFESYRIGQSVGKGIAKSITHRAAISKATMGVPKTKTNKWTEAREQERFSWQTRYSCPVCGKVDLTSINFHTYHGDKCGKVPHATKGLTLYHHPVTRATTRIRLGDPIPEGYVKGQVKKRASIAELNQQTEPEYS